MLNQDKYKTIEERVSEFQRFCNKQKGCTKCAAVNNEETRSSCAFHWLALESVENPEPCPFCESSCTAHKGVDMVRPHVSCDNEWCGYRSAEEPTIEDAIAAHNSVARAVRAEKEKAK